jgi:hypothetical protein
MRFDRLLVRTSDYRGRYRLPTDPPADPNEIVVTGNKASGKALLRLTIAEDRLAACSSLSYAAKGAPAYPRLPRAAALTLFPLRSPSAAETAAPLPVGHPP